MPRSYELQPPRHSERQKQHEHRTIVPWGIIAARQDSTFVPAHDVGANPQPKTRPRPLLCRIKRLKEVAMCLSTHPAAIIRNGNAYALAIRSPIRCSTNPQLQSAAMGHCIKRIADQVDHYLLQLARLTAHLRGRVVASRHCNSRRADSVIVQRERIINDGRYRQPDRISVVTVETQRLRSDLGEA
jgi:hypothetical protein